MEYTEFLEIKPFILKKRNKVNFGIFFFLRLIFSYKKTGGNILQNVIFNIILILTSALAFVLDIILILFIVLYLLFKQIIPKIWELTFYLFKTIVDFLLKKFAGTIIILLSIIVFVIIIYFRFNFISEKILQIFDKIIT